MVEAQIEVNTSFILKWIGYNLIKFGEKLLEKWTLWLEIIINEIDFLLKFDYSRANIIQHLTQKAMVFFGYDPNEIKQTKAKIRRLKKVTSRKFSNGKPSISTKKTTNLWQKYFKLSGMGRKKSKKNQNYFIPKQE
jgi:uncharacterized protein YfbU (UPF0304 family)